MPRKSVAQESGFTILVVDDQEELRESVRSLLMRDGHRVLTAESGEEALGLFEKNQVHLVLLDYFMPRMTGDDVVREIRKLDPFVQIILLTGYSGQKPARAMMTELDIQGYHDKADGPEKLLMWVDVGLKAQKMVASLRERERLHSELVANVSHEFRTPLNVIGGYATLLLDGEFGLLPDGADAPLRSMSEATSNLTDLVADFLNYAKLEARAMEVSPQPIASQELGHEIQRLGSLLVEGRDVDFVVETTPRVPSMLMTDLVKLRTILRNLVTNAVKFTSRGSISVRFDRANGGVQIAVRDTGPGIAREDMQLIFEPFRQLNDASFRSRGFGLGLALSRKLACVIGATLDVDSEVGVGSTFTRLAPDSVVGGQAFARVTAGFTHACGLTSAGQAWCWGEGASGELGTGNTASSTVPV
ncbi:MAG: response regulator, partial [Deltaproteobacteria bacterium]|nr:response regulator [Deltaproteobacteria bacterium]